MTNKFYILSKDLGDGPHLIGILERLDDSTYTFRYLLKEEPTEKQWFLKIPGFNDINRIYTGDKVKDGIIHRMVPEEDHMFINSFLEQESMSVYDEWELLNKLWERWDSVHKVTKYPYHDMKERVYLYKVLPRRLHRHD